jgi:peptidoglycan/LPS O-acetylase OafA/YrhL
MSSGFRSGAMLRARRLLDVGEAVIEQRLVRAEPHLVPRGGLGSCLPDAIDHRTHSLYVRLCDLGGAFDPRNNSLNALRLGLATAVIVSHAWPLGGFADDPELGDMSPGGWAVAGFFAISGYLIASSRTRASMGSFLWRRFLRIFPGLWVCLLFTAVVFVPIAAAREGGSPIVPVGPRVSWLVSNGLLVPDHYGIAGTLAHTPYEGVWNGSLWTLLYEVGCYLLLGLMLSLAVVRRHPQVVGLAFLVAVALTVIDEKITPLPSHRVATAAWLATFFLAGSLAYLYAHRIPMHWALGVGAGAILVVAAVFDDARVSAALPLAYLCLWLGVVLPFQRVGRVNDISYGVYIYAFPVQQLLALYGAQTVGLAGFVILSIVATLPFAAASWLLVERHAMRLKRVPRRSASATKPAFKPLDLRSKS